jgi:hypothetical protein
MSWCGSVCDWVEENVIEPVEEVVEDATEFVEDNIVDPVTDVVDEMVDALEEGFEDLQDLAEALAEVAVKVGEKIAEAWDDLKEGASDFLSSLWDGMQDAWSSLVDTLEEWGEAIKEGVDAAVEWLKNAAEAVLEFVVDEVIPWVVSLLMLPWIIVGLVGSLIALSICWLTSKFTAPEEVTVMKAITDHHPRVLEDFRILRLPVEDKYVVFSDIHLFVNGYYNFYQNNGNGDIHKWLLSKKYGPEGWYLIDNGDVEDFWMGGGSVKTQILDVADELPYPYYYQAYATQAAWSALQVLAVGIFNDNAATYGLVDTQFVAKGRYARTVGNHDDAWDRSDMLPLFDIVYRRPIAAHDYILLDDSSTGETRYVLAHGHQSDIWNMRLCDFAGKWATQALCVLTDVSFGQFSKLKKFYRDRDDWEAELNGHGFDNELHDMEGLLGLRQSLDEIELYEDLEETYRDSPIQPHLILGHTHNVKDHAGVPNYMYKSEWNWREYSNTGTTGMWAECVTCLELDHGTVTPVLWYLSDDGSVQREPLSSYRYGDTYLH